MSTQERDAALETVAENSGRWIDQAFAAVKSTQWPSLVTGEDIRFALTEKGLVPHHPNAWGALTRKLMVAGVLAPTDQFVNMKDRSSHSRMTRQYRVMVCARPMNTDAVVGGD